MTDFSSESVPFIVRAKENRKHIELESFMQEQADKEFWFISNGFDLSAKHIADAYRCRWDIEVFSRFIKQELHVSHLVSLNKNGIEVMLYMTLIVAMLILIYKLANSLGYKTAKKELPWKSETSL